MIWNSIFFWYSEFSLCFHFSLEWKACWLVKKALSFHNCSCFQFLPEDSVWLWVIKNCFQSCPWIMYAHFLKSKMGFCVWAMTSRSDLIISEKNVPPCSTCKRRCMSVWDASCTPAFVFICAIISLVCQWGWYLHQPHRGAARFTSLKFAKCQVPGSKMGWNYKEVIFSIQKLIF